MTDRDKYLELLKLSLIDALAPTTCHAISNGDGSVREETLPESKRYHRMAGRDWPANGTTMIGYARLSNLQHCIERIVADRVPGDVIETGVWRGGAVVFMRAVLDLLGDDRMVWAADSFEGLPDPDPQAYPEDEGDLHHTVDFLRASLDDVKRNFTRYGISTDRVRFLPGWFRDTLPSLQEQEWALVRLDGDMYESTILGLEHLYPKLSEGGFVVVDDYGAVPGCKAATDHYRNLYGIGAQLTSIDWTGHYWRKEANA